MNDGPLVIHHCGDQTHVARAPSRTRISVPILRAAIDQGADDIQLIIRVGNPLPVSYRVTAWDDTTSHLIAEREDQE